MKQKAKREWRATKENSKRARLGRSLLDKQGKETPGFDCEAFIDAVTNMLHAMASVGEDMSGARKWLSLAHGHFLTEAMGDDE